MARIEKNTKKRPWEGDSASRTFSGDKAQAFYNSPTWRALSRAKRQVDPLCVACYKAGKVQAGAVVDHIKPISQGGALLDWGNLQTLCVSCHNSKSSKERKRG